MSGWFFKELTQKQVAGRVVFFAMILVAVLLSVICVTTAFQWVNKPFPGFLINQRMIIGTAVESHWTAKSAHLKYPHKILKANEQTLSTPYDLARVVQQTPVGDTIRYTVKEGDTTFEVGIATMRFSVKDLILAYGTYLSVGVLYLLMGIIVFILKPDTTVNWLFFIACFLQGISNIVAFDTVSTHLGLLNIKWVAHRFLPAVLIHLALYFPNRLEIGIKYQSLAIVPYVVSAVLLTTTILFYPGPIATQVYRLSVLYLNLAVLLFIIVIVIAFIKKTSILARQRAKVVLLGSLVAFPFPAIATMFRIMGIPFIGNLASAAPLLIFPLSIGYAISKHNLFDVDVYIKRAVGYGIMTIIVGSIYFAVQLMVKSVLLQPILGSYAENIYPIIFAILVVFFFNPLNSFVQGLIEKLFFRKKFVYKDTVLKVSNALTSVLNLDEVITRIIQTVRKEMFIDTAGVILVGAGEGGSSGTFIRESDATKDEEVEMKFAPDDPLVTLISQEKKLISKYDVTEDQRYKSVSETCDKRFEETGSSLAMPLTYQDEVVGILTLGYKKSGRFYSRDDIDLLGTLANQGAIAIENARLFEENIEKTRMEEELKIAHDIQVSMLPEHSPEVEGFAIAASSFPAREVGGDFYDFIEVGEESDKKLGVIVGDVAGKAVSGALVMAAARSIFRVLADPETSVSDMMLLGNRRLKQDVKKGMFVALLYALLDPIEKKMTIVNAGQTQPIICRNSSDKPEYIDSEGDRFPLGIVEDCDYQETVVDLKPGDTVVFYTDGIVEAMNAVEEMYGFDRFMDVIHTNKALDAHSFLRTLMSDVTHFVGDAEQHDDLTIVAVKVH